MPPALKLCVVSESAFSPAREHGVHTAFVEQVRALRASGVEVRVNDPRAARSAHATVTHSPGPFAVACLARARIGIAFAHVTPEDLRDSLRLEPLWRGAGRAYLRFAYRRAARVVAVSRSAGSELERLGIGTGRIFHIPNGIDTGRIAAARDPAAVARVRQAGRPGRPLVLGVGQLQLRKGVDRFVAAARALPDYDFAWVGGRPMGALSADGPALQRLFGAGAPPNVRLAGTLSRAELLAHYHAADILLVPSRHENFSQVVVEAAAAGVPLVLADLPVFRENFARGAVLAEPAELAGAVRSVVEDPAARARAERGAGEIARRYSSERSAAALVGLVRELEGAAA